MITLDSTIVNVALPSQWVNCTRRDPWASDSLLPSVASGGSVPESRVLMTGFAFGGQATRALSSVRLRPAHRTSLLATQK